MYTAESSLSSKLIHSVILSILLAATTAAQTITATVNVGSHPIVAAVNPITNKIYVANQDDGTVTVIDGATNQTQTVQVGMGPTSVAVNPVTNKIYVANSEDGTFSEIDGATNTQVSYPAGTTPTAVAVNPVTNKVYIANFGDGTVTIYDPVTTGIRAVQAGLTPVAVAVNTVTNHIYVACNGSNNVVSINADNNNAVKVIGVGNQPTAIAVNQVTNKIYVTNQTDTTLSSIDGVTNVVKTVSVASGSTLSNIAVNPVTNQIYIADFSAGYVFQFDGSTLKQTDISVPDASQLALNPVTNQMYVTNTYIDTVTVIDGSTSKATVLPAGASPQYIVVNPVTNKAYGLNVGDNTVSVIDGASNTTATVPVGSNSVAAAVNPVTNKIYVPSYGDNQVTVIDGATNATTTVQAGTGPIYAAVNPLTNKIYVANFGSNDVTVIDGETNNTTTVQTMGVSPRFVAVNPVTNQIYVGNTGSANVTVIDGATNNTTLVPVPVGAAVLAVNPVTNKIYTINGNYSPNVTVIDGATNTTSTIPVGGYPTYLAVNPVTNQIYVTSNVSKNLSIIDGASGTVMKNISVGTDPVYVAVNTVTNKIYVLNSGDFTVTVIDGLSYATSLVATDKYPGYAAVNPVTNKIYVSNFSGNDVTVIDGATNTTSTIPADKEPVISVLNPITNKVYVVNQSGNDVTVITEAPTYTNLLTNSITALTNNQTTTPVPAFTFSASGTTADPAHALFYQFDTWQGAWTAASGSEPAFSGAPATLQPGFHILYSYAADGQEATSAQPTSPFIGQMQAYGFLVLPPPSPDLVVTVTPNGRFTQGQIGEWDVQVSNTAASADAATSGTTTVVDTLPAGYSLASYNGAGWSCSGTTTLTCTSSQVVAGASGMFPLLSLIVNIPAASAVSVTDNVSAYGGGDQAHTSLDTAATGISKIPVVQVAASISIQSGNNQTVAIDTQFPLPLVVTVLDAANVPVSGQSVAFTTRSSGPSGLFTNSSNTITIPTDASGMASAQFTANGTAGGPYNVTASALSLHTYFALTNTAGFPASITPVSGATPQMTTVNTPFAAPLAVTVKDTGGNLVSGANVIFTAPSSGASGIFSNNSNTITLTTNNSGIASTSFIANGTAGGPYSVTALASATVFTSLSLTNTQATQTIMFGTISTQTVGIPLTLTATASSNLPVSYQSTTQTVCTVSGSTATFLSPGPCSITASQSGNGTYAAAQSVTQMFTVMPNKPVISAIQAITVGGNSAVISWTTDQPSTSQVNYGLTSSYGSSSTPDNTLVTSHSVTINGLTPETTYNFDVISTNSINESTTSSNTSFVTTPYVGYVAFWGVNNSSVTISWSTDMPANTFVAYGTTPALGQTSPVQSDLSNSHGLVLTGLNPGTTYYFRTESTTTGGNIGGSAIYSFTTTGSPASPAPVISSVLVSAITTTSATITWKTDQPSSSLVNYGTTTSYGSSSPLDSSLVTSHTVSLSGLTPGTTYNFNVISTNSTGTSAGMSTNYTFQTTPVVSTPPAITNVTAGTITGASATITWTTDQPSWSLVNYGFSTSYGSSSQLDTNLVTSHSVTLTGLTPGRFYDFDVVSENAAGLSSRSTNYFFQTTAANAIPPQVGYVAFWGINNSGVTISWSTDVPANTQLAYGTSSAALTQLTPLQPDLTNSHGVVLTGLNSGTTYYFQAQSTGSNGATGYSTVYSFTTTGVAPSAPAPVISNVMTGNLTSTSVVITWITDQGASSQVNYGTTTSYASSSTLDSTLTTSHSVTLTGLMPGTTYNFDVMSANLAATSSTSANYTFTTTGTAPAPVITAVTASNVTSGTAMITWTTDQAATSQVNYGATTSYGSSTTLDPTLVTSHSVMLTGLTPNTMYNFDVVSASSSSSTSSNYTFATAAPSAAPPVISYLAFWGITSSGVTISWSTNVPANTSVAYGTTPSLGQMTPVQTTLATTHGLTLTGLMSGQTYYFAAQSADVNGNTGSSTVYSFTTLAGVPTISAVTATPNSNNTATISWTTSVPTTSYVQYGPAAGSYNRYSAPTGLTASPQVTLSYVPSGTVHYQLVSTDANGNQVTSPDAAFMEP